MVRAATPTITARQTRTTRRFFLGNFGLIIICNLSLAKLARTLVPVDAFERVVVDVGRGPVTVRMRASTRIPIVW